MAMLNVTLNQISQLSKMFPNAKGISVTENTISVNFNDRNEFAIREIVDELSGTDVVCRDFKGKEVDEKEVIDALVEKIDNLNKELEEIKADAIKWAKKYDDLGYEYNKLYAAYFDGKLVWKED